MTKAKEEKKKVSKKGTTKKSVPKKDAKKLVKDTKNSNEKASVWVNRLMYLLIIILIILVLSLIGIKIANRFDLDTSSDLVTELHNYFITEDLSACAGLINYSSEIVEYDDIDTEDKLCLAYQKSEIPEDSETTTYDVAKKSTTCTTDGMTFRADDDADTCEVTIIDKDVIDSTYLKLFGEEIEIEDGESFKVDNYNICYLNGDYYYCGLSETYTYTLGNEATIYRVISKAVEKSDTIELYDYFVMIKSDSCYKYYTPNTINSDCTDNYDSETTKINYKFVKKYGTEYVHTYKKADDGTYYWVSSEPVS